MDREITTFYSLDQAKQVLLAMRKQKVKEACMSILDFTDGVATFVFIPVTLASIVIFLVL